MLKATTVSVVCGDRRARFTTVSAGRPVGVGTGRVETFGQWPRSSECASCTTGSGRSSGAGMLVRARVGLGQRGSGRATCQDRARRGLCASSHGGLRGQPARPGDRELSCPGGCRCRSALGCAPGSWDGRPLAAQVVARAIYRPCTNAGCAGLCGRARKCGGRLGGPRRSRFPRDPAARRAEGGWRAVAVRELHGRPPIASFRARHARVDGLGGCRSCRCAWVSADSRGMGPWSRRTAWPRL